MCACVCVRACTLVHVRVNRGCFVDPCQLSRLCYCSPRGAFVGGGGAGGGDAQIGMNYGKCGAT